MKKFNNRGFLLTELLVTATLVSTVLIFLYAQFFSIKRSYENSFRYNTVNNLYALDNVRSFLIDEGYIDTYDELVQEGKMLSSIPFVELTEFINSDDYFDHLITVSKISKLYFTNENLDSFRIYINSHLNSSNASDYEGLRKFVGFIDYNSDSKYRLIAEFSDNTFATLLVGGE